MSDAANNGTPTPAPAAKAAEALGGMMMGESSPFPADNDLPDHSDDIASIFGLGEEAGPVPNSSESQSEGGASPSGATPAAEGGGEQVQPATPPTPQPTPGQQGDQSQAPAPASPQPAAPTTAPEQPAAPAPDPNVAALTAQVQALIAHNAQLQAQIAQGGVQPQSGPVDQSGQPAQPAVADPYMDYRLSIPDDVAAAVFNEDPNVARSGMAHLINSLGRIIHERVVKSVTDIHLPQQLQRFQGDLTMTQQQQQMRTEYFKDFPQHDDPATRLIVAQEADTMWRTNPTLDWNAQSRAALGQRVNARLGGGITPAPVAQPLEQQPTVQPAPRPAAQMGASTRPAPIGQDEGNFIHDVLTA